jgi:hypothetical protein
VTVLEFSGGEREDLPYRKYCMACRGIFRDMIMIKFRLKGERPRIPIAADASVATLCCRWFVASGRAPGSRRGGDSYPAPRHWAFLPTLLAELAPGFDLFPTWTAAVFYVTRQRVRSEEPEILPPGARSRASKLKAMTVSRIAPPSTADLFPEPSVSSQASSNWT